MLPPDANIRKASGFTLLSLSNQKASIYGNKTKMVKLSRNPPQQNFNPFSKLEIMPSLPLLRTPLSY